MYVTITPGHQYTYCWPTRPDSHTKEKFMSTQLSTKLAALGVAVMMNGMMIGLVAYLFSARLHQPTTVNATAMTATSRSAIPTI